jgi:hypothetical protein
VTAEDQGFDSQQQQYFSTPSYPVGTWSFFRGSKAAGA